jgi:Kazal-type serine protease inhibitor domain
MKKTIFASALLLGCTLMSCKKTNMAAQEQAGRNPVVNTLCQGKPLKGVNCLDVYQPVCGCDGVTYSNGCYASVAGIKSYTQGECGGGGGTIKQAK